MIGKYINFGEITINFRHSIDHFVDNNLRKIEDGGILFYTRVDKDDFPADRKNGDILVEKYAVCELSKGLIQDRRIMLDFGIQETESSLEGILYLAYLQKDGDAGTLLVNGLSNVFYIRDKVGETRALFLTWKERVGHDRFCDKKAFTFFSLPITLVTGWEKGTRIFIPITD